MSSSNDAAFHYSDNQLVCEGTELARIAKRFGTPVYVYSRAEVLERFHSFKRAFVEVPHTICYAVKANSNLSLLKLLAKAGAGFDVVSGGEIIRVSKASRTALKSVVFSGVGKSEEEIALALDHGILLFNVESEQELALLEKIARRKRKPANVAFRVNPDVSADTHPYISTGLHEHKFGVPMDRALLLYERAANSRHVKPAGVSVHIGSQIHDFAAFAEAMARVAQLVRELRSKNIEIAYVDAGGGLGIDYRSGESIGEFANRAASYAKAILQPLRGLGVHLILEPGRAIIAPAGVLLTRVVYTKRNTSKQFAVVDAAMNDLIRPSLYQAFHRIVPVRPKSQKTVKYDVVGPICESGDFLARDRELPELNSGDLVAVLDAGAYGMSLASNYNSRPRAAEVLIQGKKAQLIRKRESMKDLLRNEL